MTKTCVGCGAVLQSEDKNIPGYIPENQLTKEVPLCMRCFRLRNYHEITKSSLSSDDFLNILQNIALKDALIVYVIDIFDYNGSVISGLTRHLDNQDILVIANKRDVLPKSVKDGKIVNWLQKQLKDDGIKPLDIILTSALRNYQLDDIMNAIQLFRKNRDVYVIGTTNVGKSSLVNAILKNYSEENEVLITTSEFPGTTLGLIQIPLDETTYMYDTPGIINAHQLSHQVELEDLKFILPQKELNPIVYQLNYGQSLYIGGLARIDYISGGKTSFICYFPNQLEIHRTKLINADGLYNRHMTLRPEIGSIETISQMSHYEFKINKDERCDIIISGLGFVTITGNNQIIRIHAPKGVGVMRRKALI